MNLLISEGWTHTFADKSVEVRFVLDVSALATRTLTYKDFQQIGVRYRKGWRQAFRVEADEVLDSLVNGNPDLLDNPAAYDIKRSATGRPDWVHPSVGTPLL